MSNKTVHPDGAIGMVRLSPTARLEWLLRRNDLAQAHEMIRQLLHHYEEFLASTNHSEEELVQQILTSEKGKELFPSANEFGNLMFNALQAIGQGSELHRFLVV